MILLNMMNLKDKNISFREHLTLQADEFENNIDISKDLEKIKIKLKEYYYKRTHTISLIKVKKGPIAFGEGNESHTSLFIPYGVSPLSYRQLFINALSKLGFDENCMELWEQDYDKFYEYNIVLKW